ncbi:MAG: hypothetical protein QXU98_04055 [Candidatus Parvarchaeota archaeon]
MILFHPYINAFKESQVETWDFLNSHKALFESLGIDVYDKLCDFDNFKTYKRELINIWDRDDILILEMDIVPTEEALKDIVKCPEPLCAYDYSLYNETNTAISAHRIKDPVDKRGWRNLRNEKFADYVGFGFTKIKKCIQHKISITQALPLDKFVGPDVGVSMATSELGLKWHIHYPALKHNHKPGEVRWNV